MMDVNKIMSADFLDILFDGRNKEYGAYELRRSYNKRLTVAITAMILIALMIFLGSVISKEAEKNKKAKMEVQDVKLEEVKEQPKNEPPPPPPPPKMPEPPKIEIFIRYHHRLPLLQQWLHQSHRVLAIHQWIGDAQKKGIEQKVGDAQPPQRLLPAFPLLQHGPEQTNGQHQQARSYPANVGRFFFKPQSDIAGHG